MLALVPALALAACRDRAGRDARAPDTLVVALQTDARTLDPHQATDAASMRVIENLYSTLVRQAPTLGEVEPDLAERWHVSDDGLVYTFHLRPGARFHSGRPVGSEDVRSSIERIREEQIRADHFAAVQSIETPDPHTVVFRLREPSAPFLSFLANPMNAIVDRAAVSGGLDLSRAEAGSGPFVLREWKKDQHLIVERFDDYFVPGRPRLARVRYRPLPDESARTTALRTGEVDLVLDVSPRDARILEGSGVTVRSVPGTFWEYVGLNTRRPPLDDPRVRRALAWAIDRPVVDDLVKLGRATVLEGGHLPPSHWAYAPIHSYPRRDLERARALLAEAGLPGGFELELKVGSDFPYQVNAAQVVKQHLAPIGVRARIVMQESGLFFDSLARHDFEATLVGWVGFVDPDEWFWNVFHSEGKWNQQGFASPELDALLVAGRRTLDRAKRRAIYAEAQRIVAEQAPVVSLYVDRHVSAHVPALVDYVVRPTASTLALRDAALER